MADIKLETVVLAIADGVARVTLSRPDKLNAFDSAVQADLRAALDLIEADPSIRVVILTGAGRAFSAGQDLAERRKALAEGDLDLGALLEVNYHPLICRLAALPAPVIAAVNGVAAGAAAAIAIGCDITIAARSASFQFPFVKVALGPDAGTSWLLPRLIGRQRAMMLVLTGGRTDASTAADWGLIAQVVEDAELLPAVEALARDIAAGASGAVAEAKALVRGSLETGFEVALHAEAAAQSRCGRDPDYREAITAFAEKRAPKFAR